MGNEASKWEARAGCYKDEVTKAERLRNDALVELKQAAETIELLRRQNDADRTQMERIAMSVLYKIRDKAAIDESVTSVDKNVDEKIRPVPGFIEKMIEGFLTECVQYEENSEEYKSLAQSIIKLVMGQASSLRSVARGVISMVEQKEADNVVDKDRSKKLKDALNLVLEKDDLFMKKARETLKAVNASAESIDLDVVQKSLAELIQAVGSVPTLLGTQSMPQFLLGLMSGEMKNLQIGQNQGNAIPPNE